MDELDVQCGNEYDSSAQDEQDGLIDRFSEIREKRRELERQLLDLENSRLTSCSFDYGLSPSSQSARSSYPQMDDDGWNHLCSLDLPDRCEKECVPQDRTIDPNLSSKSWKDLRHCLSSLERAIECMNFSLSLDRGSLFHETSSCDSRDFKLSGTSSDDPFRSSISLVDFPQFLENDKPEIIVGEEEAVDFSRAGTSDDEYYSMPRSRLDESAIDIFVADLKVTEFIPHYSTEVLKSDTHEAHSESGLSDFDETKSRSYDSVRVAHMPNDGIRWLIQCTKAVKGHITEYQSIIDSDPRRFQISIEKGELIVEMQRTGDQSPRQYCTEVPQAFADPDNEKRFIKIQNVIHLLSVCTIQLCDFFATFGKNVKDQARANDPDGDFSKQFVHPTRSLSSYDPPIWMHQSSHSQLDPRPYGDDTRIPPVQSKPSGSTETIGQSIYNRAKSPRLVSLDIDLIGISVAQSQIRSLEIDGSIAALEQQMSQISCSGREYDCDIDIDLAQDGCKSVNMSLGITCDKCDCNERVDEAKQDSSSVFHLISTEEGPPRNYSPEHMHSEATAVVQTNDMAQEDMITMKHQQNHNSPIQLKPTSVHLEYMSGIDNDTEFPSKGVCYLHVCSGNAPSPEETLMHGSIFTFRSRRRPTRTCSHPFLTKAIRIFRQSCFWNDRYSYVHTLDLKAFLTEAAKKKGPWTLCFQALIFCELTVGDSQHLHSLWELSS
jgi:hypothetical protein